MDNKRQIGRTTNGMKTPESSLSKAVDFFYRAGAMRNQDILPIFADAFAEDKTVALRLAQWLRDVRGGAGERQNFRHILVHLAETDVHAALALMEKVPEVGRWDDLLCVAHVPEAREKAVEMFGLAIKEGNALAAKWIKVTDDFAREVAGYLNMPHKAFRKLVTHVRKGVVENYMTTKRWGEINYSHVPSQASRIYSKAFRRHDEVRYSKHVADARAGGGETGAKINAAAVYPHEIISPMLDRHRLGKTEEDRIVAQWNSLPNWVGEGSILCMADVSASMSGTPLNVAVSLALYTSERNVGPFRDAFMTFSDKPQINVLYGDIAQRVADIKSSEWGMNTNLVAAFGKILATAKKANAKAKDMPKTLLIISDMQFDKCVAFDDNAFGMIARNYKDAGYDMPNVVFWNVRDAGGVPVEAHQSGAALVSGYSPSILEAVMKADMSDYTPQAIMLNKIMSARYDIAASS